MCAQSLRSISLIALLRMGLGKGHKDRLYSSFARMPLYEDMAPWNIVAQGSGLEYIDQVRLCHCARAYVNCLQNACASGLGSLKFV